MVKLLVALLAIAMLAASPGVVAGQVVSERAAAQGSAGLSAKVTAVMDNGKITYTVSVENSTNTPVANVYLAVTVPAGLTSFQVVATPRGAGFSAVEAGAAAWLVDSVPANGSVGPFSYSASVTGATPDGARVFVHWRNPAEGSYLSDAVTPTMAGLLPGAIKISAVVPAMGEHWAIPKDLPLGPLYGVYGGKITFLEYMISQEDFRRGVDHTQLLGNKGLPAIDHIDIEFQPQGHEGYTIPHFDIHAYMVSHAEHEAIRP